MVRLVNITKSGALLLGGGLLLIGCSGSASDSDATPAATATATNTSSSTASGEATARSQTPTAEPLLVSGADPVVVALAITEWKQQLVEIDRTKVRELITQVAHPDWVDSLTNQAEAEMVLLDEQAPAGASLKLAPIELRLLSQTDSTAVVEIWAVQIVTGGGAIHVGYSTLIVSLAMSDGVWLLTDLDSRPGPVPTPTQAITDPLVFVAELTGFSDAQQPTP